MTTSVELRHVAFLAKQFGKVRSFALEALLHAALNSMDGDLKASTGHTLGQNVDAMHDLLRIIRAGNADDALEGDVFAALLARDDVDSAVIDEAESLLAKLQEVRDRIESATFPKAAELDDLFEIYTQFRIRTSGFLRQIEALSDELRSQVEQGTEIRSRMSTTISDLERMSGAINILAINASVEASRTGSSGAAFRVIANEMQRLSQTSSGMLRTTRQTLGL